MSALFLVCVIDVLGFGIMIPLLPYMADRFGAAPAAITAILGSYSACQLIAAPLWGRLSDRFGRRPILLTSMLGACSSYILLAFAHTLTLLLVSRMLAGVMAGNLSAAMAYASDISRPADRAKTLGMIGAAIGLGFMLGPVIGGVLAGNSVQTANFQLPALLSAALSITAMLLVLTVLPESRTPAQRAEHHARGGGRIWQALKTRPALRWMTLASLLVTFSQSTLESIFAIWALYRYNAGPRTVGFALFALAIVAVTMQGGFVRMLVPRFGEHRVAMAGIAGYVVGLLTVAFAGSLVGVIIGLVLVGLGAGSFNPAGSALASHEAGEHNRGAVMGTYQTGTSLARVLAPFIAGPVYMRFGANSPYLLAAFVTVQALWCIVGARRHRTVELASDGNVA